MVHCGHWFETSRHLGRWKTTGAAQASEEAFGTHGSTANRRHWPLPLMPLLVGNDLRKKQRWRWENVTMFQQMYYQQHSETLDSLLANERQGSSWRILESWDSRKRRKLMPLSWDGKLKKRTGIRAVTCGSSQPKPSWNRVSSASSARIWRTSDTLGDFWDRNIIKKPNKSIEWTQVDIDGIYVHGIPAPVIHKELSSSYLSCLFVDFFHAWISCFQISTWM